MRYRRRKPHRTAAPCQRIPESHSGYRLLRRADAILGVTLSADHAARFASIFKREVPPAGISPRDYVPLIGGLAPDIDPGSILDAMQRGRQEGWMVSLDLAGRRRDHVAKHLEALHRIIVAMNGVKAREDR